MISHNVFSALPYLFLGVALLLATPSSGEDITVDWIRPSTGTTALPSMTAAVGDTVTFDWTGFHDVFVHPTGDCDETGRILVGASTGATYTFTGTDVGELVFACDIQAHCEQGLIVTFTVSAVTPAPTSSTSAPSKAPSVTSAPSVTPTQSPTSGTAPIMSQCTTTVAALMVCTTAFAYAGLME